MSSKETKKHTKHTALIRPRGGDYHTNEWALIGAPCSVINEFANRINQLLSKRLKVGYLDADHKEGELPNAFHSSFTDKINHRTYVGLQNPGQKQNRKFYNDLDLLLINGNHFVGAKQIVFIDEKKKDSLSRKIDRLGDVRVIVLKSSSQEVYDFVKRIVKDKADVFTTVISDIEGVVEYMIEDHLQNIPQLHGLVLAGGKSQRMGEDKGAIDYHGKPQREHQGDLLNTVCFKTFISYRDKTHVSDNSNYEPILDTFEGLGPYGGILSAFREHPNHAWMTVACDLPYMNKETIAQLAAGRDASKIATCFYNPETKFPEPLITIWEPRAYPVLLEFLSQGYSCPRKVLINTDIAQLQMEDIVCMTNVNDKVAYEIWKKSKKSV